MLNIDDLCAQYDLDQDDDSQAIEHVEYLLGILSLEFMDTANSLEELGEIEYRLENIGQSCLDEYYNAKVCSLAERATIKFMRFRSMITRIVDHEADIILQETRSETVELMKARNDADLLIDAANNSFLPEKLLERLVRASRTVGFDENNELLDCYYESHTGLEAIDNYLIGVRAWMESFMVNVVQDGIDQTFLNIFSQVFQGQETVDFLRALAKQESRFFFEPNKEPLFFSYFGIGSVK